MSARPTKCAAGIAVVCAVLGFNADAQGQNSPLLIFGGQGHKTFLGCLNCNRFSTSSICNQLGEKGSKFNAESIWNQFGTYGSEFSSDSPWNKFSTTAPIIVDQQGRSYGYLSANNSTQTELGLVASWHC